MEINYKNKNIIVTGGSRGIGCAIVKAFGESGGNVISTYLKEKEKALTNIHSIAGSGLHTAIHLDVESNESFLKIFNIVKNKYNTLDVVVVNAGIAIPNDITKISIDNYEKVIKTNLLGSFQTVQTFLPILNTGSTIIMISSIRGLFHCADPFVADYCSSKAGVNSLVKSFARKLGPDIRVNAIAPGFTLTDQSLDWGDDLKYNILQQNCIKRFGTTTDIANATLFLASEYASYITGHILVVDGGYTV